ncbi:hypothetical protein [Saccharopolyspora sp. 5N708]|uniref:hypothetical protein n=1 Tax=Saccharopolyspora sp. 5N708 TaxID=3457424 RepID=UPI003FD23D7F
MTYVVVLGERELQSIDEKLEIELRLTKALPSSIHAPDASPQLALVCSRSKATPHSRSPSSDDSTPHRLVWLGMVMRPGGNSVGAVDKSITIDPLRRCKEAVPLDGSHGLLKALGEYHSNAFNDALRGNSTTILSRGTSDAFVDVVRRTYPSLGNLMEWLLAMAEPSPLDSNSIEDRSWQEQQDSLGTLFRAAKFPVSAIAAWKRPPDRNAPYLAGLIPEPVEHALIDHDTRTTGEFTHFFGDFLNSAVSRCDIQEFFDDNGRRLEVANINATPVESRLGADMIYYHEATKSFVLVQYKRISSDFKNIHVDSRLLDQMDRLDEVARLSREPQTPSDWRLSRDSCFLKLARWPNNRPNDPRLPAEGMYLPVSYARMLLNDECTRGPRNGRILGYETVERYLVTTQFTELVQHGLAGTVGTTVEQLRELVVNRALEGYSVTAGIEHATETERERQNRVRARGKSKKKGKRTARRA